MVCPAVCQTSASAAKNVLVLYDEPNELPGLAALDSALRSTLTASVPAGAIIQFREVSLWDTYRWHIILVIGFCVIEALLVFLLLVQRARRARAEEQLALLQTITVDVMAAKDLHEALEVVLRRVCETTNWVLGQAWLPAADNSVLVCGPVWVNQESHGLKEFITTSEQMNFASGVGLPGHVWESKQQKWLSGLVTNSNFPRAEVAAKAGLKTGLGIPIISGDEVVAVIEFFLCKPRREDERLVELIVAVAAQLGIVIARKQAESPLIQTRTGLAHAGRLMALGELAASIAHEVNQPLTAIVGNSDVCLTLLNDNLPGLEVVREALVDIQSDGKRASEIIKRIRSLVRRDVPQKTVLDINQIVTEVVALVNHEAARRRIRVKMQLGEQLPPVLGDRVQLQQVLLNLIMNGIDAMAGIAVDERELVAETCLKDNAVTVGVRDRGPGVDVRAMEKLFDAFYSTKPDGMGMGLSISRSIIDAHGGRLWASTNNGQGAHFQFSLPISAEILHE